MKQQNCEFCAARKRVLNLFLVILACMFGGMFLGDLVRPINSDISLFVVCLGFSAAAIATWQCINAVNRFEEIRRSGNHPH